MYLLVHAHISIHTAYLPNNVSFADVAFVICLNLVIYAFNIFILIFSIFYSINFIVARYSYYVSLQKQVTYKMKRKGIM